MAFSGTKKSASKSPKGLKRTPFKPKQGPGLKAAPRPQNPQLDAKTALKKATLRALKSAKVNAQKHGVELTPWESEFIDDLSQRVDTYGRAFVDLDKGAYGATLSLRQGLKLKEINKKAKKTAKI